MLQGILHYNGHLRIWFDRDISYEGGEGLNADIVCLPRLVTSRSNERLTEDNRITSKRGVKLTVVERAIDSIGKGTSLASKSTISVLDKFLNTND